MFIVIDVTRQVFPMDVEALDQGLSDAL